MSSFPSNTKIKQLKKLRTYFAYFLFDEKRKIFKTFNINCTYPNSNSTKHY